MSYDELRDALRVRKDVQHGIGVIEDRIADAEHSLGPLPSDYRQFLREYGWLMVGPQDVFGLGDDVQPHMDVVRMTLAERFDGGLPKNLIAIHGDGAGNYACIDQAPGPHGAHAVVFWAHDDLPGKPPVVRAETFSDWLVGMMNRIPRR